MIAEISYFKLIMLLLGLIPIVLVMKKLEIKLINELFIGVGRMFIQLVAVGIYLKYIFNYNNIYINIGYLILMVIVTALTCGKSVGLKAKGMKYIFLSMGIVVFTVLSIFMEFILKENLNEARYVVPISGMLLGNMLKTSVVSLNRFFSYFKENQSEYEYLISLGANKYEALIPNIKNSLILSLKPTISSIATMGLVSLPGMMTGQILGGAMPTTAIRYQIAIMLLIIISEFYNIIILLAISIKRYFNEYDMLKDEYFKG